MKKEITQPNTEQDMRQAERQQQPGREARPAISHESLNTILQELKVEAPATKSLTATDKNPGFIAWGVLRDLREAGYDFRKGLSNQETDGLYGLPRLHGPEGQGILDKPKFMVDPGEPSTENPAKKPSIREQIQHISEKNEFLSHALSLTWSKETPLHTGKVRIDQALPSDFLPKESTTKRQEKAQKLGRELLDQDKDSLSKDALDSYKKNPERYYSMKVWDALADVALEDQRVGKDAEKQLTEKDWHAPVTEVPAFGGKDEARAIKNSTLSDREKDKTLEELEDKKLKAQAEALLAKKAGKDGTKLLANVTVNELYQKLTGAPLADRNRNEQFADFIEQFYNKHANEFVKFPDSLIDSFALLAHDPKDELVSVKPGRIGKAVKAISHQANKHFLMKNRAADVHIDPESAGSLKGKTPEEIIQKSLQDLGIADAGEEFVKDYLKRTAAENRSLQGVAKVMENANGTADYKEMLALKLWMDVDMWKQAVKKKGWVVETSESPKGSIQNVTEAFKQKPLEWMAREYSQKNAYPYEQDPRDQVLTDEPRIIGKKYDEWKMVAKKLVAEGKVPTTAPSADDIMRKSMHPIHQVLTYAGVTPEEVKAFYQEEMQKLPATVSPIEKVHKITQEALTPLKKNPFELRYKAQYEIDTNAAKTIAESIEKNLAKREIAEIPSGLSYPILEVTCGDNRNEAKRAAIENASDKITTVGTAGHFNVVQKEIREMVYLKPELRKEMNNFWNSVATSKEPVTQEYIRDNVNKILIEASGKKFFLADLKKNASHTRDTLYETAEFAPALGTMAATDNGLLMVGPYMLGELASFAGMGALRDKIGKKIEQKITPEKAYDVEPTLSPEDQAAFDNLVSTYRKTNDPREWAKAVMLLENKKIAHKADIVKSFLDSIALDTKEWLPGQKKLLVIEGHKAQVSPNNPAAMTYDCGACGGEAGEPNARIVANAINDPEQRAYMKENYGIDLDNVTALAAVYNTTKSRTEVFTKEALEYADADAKKLIETFQENVQIADGEAAVRHNKLLYNGKVPRGPKWLRLMKDGEVTPEQALKIAEKDSHDPSIQVPELGHAKAIAIFNGRNELLRGTVAHEDFTTFKIGPATKEQLSPVDAGIFHAVGGGILEEYSVAYLNRDRHPGKVAQSYLRMGGAIFAADSAGDHHNMTMTLPRESVAIRNKDTARPVFVWDMPVSKAKEWVNDEKVFTELIKNGYGKLVVRDSETGEWYEHVSQIDKAILKRPEQEDFVKLDIKKPAEVSVPQSN